MFFATSNQKKKELKEKKGKRTLQQRMNPNCMCNFTLFSLLLYIYINESIDEFRESAIVKFRFMGGFLLEDERCES